MNPLLLEGALELETRKGRKDEGERRERERERERKRERERAWGMKGWAQGKENYALTSPSHVLIAHVV